jgi:uncharacterized protein DUF4058
MPSPFPGMDPYLEGRVWPDFHHNLITAIQAALAPQVAPAYYVAIEERVTTIQVGSDEGTRLPDAAIIPTGAPAPPAGGGTAVAVAPEVSAVTVALPLYDQVREGYLEIRDVEHHVVVTAIEVLSPTNKIHHEGRKKYQEKRRQVLSSATSLIEIDLLRAGEPMAMTPTPESDYRVLVSRDSEYPNAQLFPFSLRQPIPTVPVPLKFGENEAQLALQELVTQVYDRARYELRLHYRLPPPEPALSPEDAAWMAELLQPKEPSAEASP